MAKQSPTEAAEVAKGKDLTLGEIGTGGKPIETISEIKFKDEVELEAFMNQEVLIEVPEGLQEGDLPVINPGVNGVNQPIIRGIPQRVKRKYVEALARSRTTTYKQTTPDLRELDKFVMRDKTAISYPFYVLSDPHPKGRAWLKDILRQAA